MENSVQITRCYIGGTSRPFNIRKKRTEKKVLELLITLILKLRQLLTKVILEPEKH